MMLVWLDGLHADDEKVEDHRDFGDRGHRCADDRVDRCGEVGGQERRKQVHDVADGGQDEHHAEPLGEPL